MFTFQFDRGNGSHLILTSTYPKFVYVSPYLTAIFLPYLTEKDMPNDLNKED